jgi:hypothetical protein
MSGYKKQEKISKVTLNYLRELLNPGNTIEGITRWWLECGSNAPGRRIGTHEHAYMMLMPLPLRFGSGDTRVKKDSNCRSNYD